MNNVGITGLVKLGYKRLETDAEFRTRVCGKWCPTCGGQTLDEHSEAWHGRQRKIVEIFP